MNLDWQALFIIRAKKRIQNNPRQKFCPFPGNIAAHEFKRFAGEVKMMNDLKRNPSPSIPPVCCKNKTSWPIKYLERNE